MGSLAQVSPVATYSALLGRVLIIIITIMASVTRLSIVLASVITVSHSLDLGYGGLPGQRTERGGSVWPPFPGANQGYWARRAGFYKSLPNFGTAALQGSSSVVTETVAVTSSTPSTTSLASSDVTSRLLQQLQPSVTAASASPVVPVYNPYSFTLYNNKLP